MIVQGYCPTLEKDHYIDVEYMDASTLAERKSIKGFFTCSIVSFGSNCDTAKNCPLYSSAPNEK